MFRSCHLEPGAYSSSFAPWAMAAIAITTSAFARVVTSPIVAARRCP